MTDEATTTIHTIAIAGGTGKEGKGLAYRWAKAGYRLIIGSRVLEKALAAADDLNQLIQRWGESGGYGQPGRSQTGGPGGYYRSICSPYSYA